jgi:hypothetical protein
VEEDRRGLFTSYTFSPYHTTAPILQEVQFFSEDSIRAFNKRICAIGSCFEGDFPDVQRYLQQKLWFQTGTGETYGEPSELGGTTYLVMTRYVDTCDCTFREYTTFVRDTKVDVWIVISDPSQASAADQLMAAFRITPLVATELPPS